MSPKIGITVQYTTFTQGGGGGGGGILTQAAIVLEVEGTTVDLTVFGIYNQTSYVESVPYDPTRTTNGSWTYVS